MMFIIRTDGAAPDLPSKLTRRTPALVARHAGQVDHFCLGEPAAARAAGHDVVPLHDGWYADDTGGGVAIWGQGEYWEIRTTPFVIAEASGPVASQAAAADTEAVNIRGAIFGV